MKKIRSVEYAVQSNELRALVPGLCRENCYDCVHYDADTNICGAASLNVFFPMFDKIREIPCGSELDLLALGDVDSNKISYE